MFLLFLQEYPTLTTFFAGEIISRKRPFLTRKWDADEDVDRKHWVSQISHNEVNTGAQLQAASPSSRQCLYAKGKFQAFYQYAKTFNSDDFDYEDLKNSDYIFMRWKVRVLPQFSERCNFFPHLKMPHLQLAPSSAPPGAVPRPRPHDQGHQRCIVRWILLHLLPEIHSDHWGLLLPQELWMVITPITIEGSWGIYTKGTFLRKRQLDCFPDLQNYLVGESK